MFPLLLLGGGAGLVYLLSRSGGGGADAASSPNAAAAAFDPAQHSIDPSGATSSLGVIVGATGASCRNNNRECPARMHCHNTTGLCVPHPTDKACHLHGCEIGESTGDCANRLGIAPGTYC